MMMMMMKMDIETVRESSRGTLVSGDGSVLEPILFLLNVADLLQLLRAVTVTGYIRRCQMTTHSYANDSHDTRLQLYGQGRLSP